MQLADFTDDLIDEFLREAEHIVIFLRDLIQRLGSLDAGDFCQNQCVVNKGILIS